MLSLDLAELYGVEPRVLNQAVPRNIERFPEDFMFQLTEEEFGNWKSQIVISNSIKMGVRHAPFAFTEQGVSMLSSVLNSRRAIKINIEIMRTFVKYKKSVYSHKELAEKLEKLSARVDVHDEVMKDLIDQLRRMINTPSKPKSQFGFRKDQEGVSNRKIK